MSETPIFKFRLVAENTTEKGKADSANENALIAEALFKQRVESRSISAPPGSPSNGQIWIVPDASASPAPSGAWAGHEDELALYYNGWIFIAPVNGPVFYVADEDLYVKYDDTASPPAWIVGGVDTFLGLSDSPASYSGQAGKAVVVNGGETGLEFGAGNAFTGARVELTASESISDAANIAIPWDTDSAGAAFDVGGFWASGTPTRLTIPSDGYYQILGGIDTESLSVTISIQLWIAVDGGGFPGVGMVTNYAPSSPSGTKGAQAQAIVHLTAGQYLELFINQSSGGPRNLDATPGTFFAITKLG